MDSRSRLSALRRKTRNLPRAAARKSIPPPTGKMSADGVFLPQRRARGDRLSSERRVAPTGQTSMWDWDGNARYPATAHVKILQLTEGLKVGRIATDGATDQALKG